MRKVLLAVAVSAALGSIAYGQAQVPVVRQPVPGPGTTEIYFLDMEGGMSTLIVSPTTGILGARETLLLDAGNLNPPGRDAERIQAALGDLDVQRVRELGTHAAGRSARGAAPELRPLDERDVDARLGQMEGGAGADHAATEDDHVGGFRRR